MSFANTWQNAANEIIQPSKGTYNVRITGGSAFTSKDGDDYAKVELMILEHPAGAETVATRNDDPMTFKSRPVQVGDVFEHFMGFKNEVGARINREALLTYGLSDPDSIRSIEDLSDAIGRLANRTADVGVGYKDGYINIRVSGSRAPVADRESDIPANGSGFDRTPEQEQQVAAAARFGDEMPS